MNSRVDPRDDEAAEHDRIFRRQAWREVPEVPARPSVSCSICAREFSNPRSLFVHSYQLHRRMGESFAQFLARPNGWAEYLRQELARMNRRVEEIDELLRQLGAT